MPNGSTRSSRTSASSSSNRRSRCGRPRVQGLDDPLRNRSRRDAVPLRRVRGRSWIAPASSSTSSVASHIAAQPSRNGGTPPRRSPATTRPRPPLDARPRPPSGHVAGQCLRPARPEPRHAPRVRPDEQKRLSRVRREERGKPPRTGGSFPRRAGSAHGGTRDARIRRHICGRPSHMLRPRPEVRRHQRQSGVWRCARLSCRGRCSRDRGVCSGPSPLRWVRPGPRLHSSCNCQHSPSTR
jgi:hypothetical protein